MPRQVEATTGRLSNIALSDVKSPLKSRDKTSALCGNTSEWILKLEK